MTKYHAVMLDETRCEFGVSFEAKNRSAAYKYLAENYVESKVVQLEDKHDAAERERLMYERLEREENGDFSEYDYEQEYGA